MDVTCSEDEKWNLKALSARNQMSELSVIRDALNCGEPVMDVIKTKGLADNTMEWLRVQNRAEPRKTALDDFF